MSRSKTSQPLAEDRKKHLDGLVASARRAAEEFRSFTQEKVDAIVRKMVIAAIPHARRLAALAVEETGLGVVEDKILKNMVACEFVYDYVKDKKTVGVIREYPEQNLVEVAEPIGVILGLTPITNPTSTVIFKSIMIVKTLNSIILSAHSRAWKSSNETARLMHDTAVAAGAPEGFLGWVDNPTRDDTYYLMQHPDIAFIDATGGTSLVRLAYGSGKPALGVGAGNTPTYIHRSADIDMAVVDILTSKTFDNSTICASEGTLIVDAEIHDMVIDTFKTLGAHVASDREGAILEKTVIDPETKMMHPMAVGQSIERISQFCGFKAPKGTTVILVPMAGVGEEHPLSVEKLFPVLSVLRVSSEKEGIEAAARVNRLGGTGHTASIFAEDERVIQKFASAVNAGRIIVNSPSSIGALGGVYNDLVPTFSFACGTGGGNSIMDNVNVYHYLNVKKVAKRTPAHMWFRVPNQIYFNVYALENLRDIHAQTVAVVCGKGGVKRGHVDRVRSYVPKGVHVHVFSEVGVEPAFTTVAEGVEFLKECKPDHVIAVGGGSVLDAAKVIRLFYVHPGLDFHELGTPFLDPRRRVVKYPPLPDGAPKLIAIPTTSGTGSEVTPFAVITDAKAGKKVSLSDASLVPDMAILDPELVMDMPPDLTATTGIDVLAHALEAGVSVFASEFTDAMAYQAARLVFMYLRKSFEDGSDREARSYMHNASCIAGIALSNASAGLCHAMAHSFGAVFKVPHGRANGIFLPHVIKYNALAPSRFMPNPNVKSYAAPTKYSQFAELMAFGGMTVEDRIANLVDRVTKLIASLRMPLKVSDLGISKEDYEGRIDGMVDLTLGDPSLVSNPRRPLIAELRSLYHEAY